jgi:hypothetical protein
VISPSPERGPDASQRTSLAIFISEAPTVFSPPWTNTIASCAASASNLFGADSNGVVGQPRQLGRDARAELRRRIQPGAHGRAAERQFAQVGRAVRRCRMP